MKITITKANTQEELQGILTLQSENLEVNISQEELDKEGFVTVVHNEKTLSEISGSYKHIIAKNEEDEVVGYVLVMLKEFAKTIPILVPMFDMIDTIDYEGASLSSADYFVVGQVCVKKGFRGRGIFRQLNLYLFDSLKKEFDFVITEVATRNPRSIKAHAKIGFNTIHEYKSDLNEEWAIILRDIRKDGAPKAG